MFDAVELTAEIVDAWTWNRVDPAHREVIRQQIRRELMNTVADDLGIEVKERP